MRGETGHPRSWGPARVRHAVFWPPALPGEELAEQIAESQEGVGDVEIDEDSGEVSVETDEGATFGGDELTADDMVQVTVMTGEN